MPERIAKTRVFEGLARTGWMVKGLNFGIMGFLALRILAGDHEEDANIQGALASMADKPGGMVVLWFVAAGLTSYGMWRMAVAIFDTEDYGRGLRGIVTRAGFASIGLFYGALAVWLATALLAGDAPQDNEDTTVWAARVLELPAGPWLLAAGAATLFGAGLLQFYRAWRALDHEHMPEEEMSFVTRHVGSWIGRAGVAARGVAFGAIGFFLARAAVEENPEEARDLGETVIGLADQPIVLGVISIGFIAYGLHCVMNARYRTIGPTETHRGRQKRNGSDVGN